LKLERSRFSPFPRARRPQPHPCPSPSPTGWSRHLKLQSRLMTHYKRPLPSSARANLPDTCACRFATCPHRLMGEAVASNGSCRPGARHDGREICKLQFPTKSPLQAIKTEHATVRSEPGCSPKVIEHHVIMVNPDRIDVTVTAIRRIVLSGDDREQRRPSRQPEPNRSP